MSGLVTRWDVPGDIEPGELRGELRIGAALAELLGLLRDVDGREALARVIGEELLELVVDLLRIDVADDDEEHVIGDVAELVIRHHVVALELVVNLEVADDREAVGMDLVGGGHELEAGHAVGIVVAHGELAADDLLLLAVLMGGRVEFIIASERMSSAVVTPFDGISIQYTVRS